MKIAVPLSALLLLAQAALSARVLRRFIVGRKAHSIRANEAPLRPQERLLVIVPVLDERERLAPCLDGLVAQGAEVARILVVDGGSRDGTQALVRAYGHRDPRITLVDAGPIPLGWNGKAWGLQVGLQQAGLEQVGLEQASLEPASRGRAGADAPWVLTLDADVRPAPLLARALLAQAQRHGVAALSVATRQEVAGAADALVHPALLTTLVYRFGPPGRAVCRVSDVQANGQCFLARRDLLVATAAFRAARASRCEDVTVARALVAAGHAVGFYEAGDLVSVRMYAGWRETWRNWPRSLPLYDQFYRAESLIRLCEVALVQALPLPLLLLLLVAPRVAGRAPRRAVMIINGALAALRLGVLCGTARAYRRRPPTYWLSPLCDVPVVAALLLSLLRRQHTWRGRALVTGGSR